MLDRLWLRLLAVISLVLVLALGGVAVLVNRATSETFADYVEGVAEARALRVEHVLTRHYQRHQSWSGADSVVQLVADLAGQRVVLADSSGLVVADSRGELVGTRVQSGWTGDPVVLKYKETSVGTAYLDPLRPTNRVDNRAQAFLEVTNRYLLWAVAAGLLATLVLSLALARWLASPLETLTRAARRMERGDLSQAIHVGIGGEVGALARAFNAMAASLASVEKHRQRMIADVAHELRTPLTNIRGYLEAIEDGVAEPDEETLGILRYELLQLTRLVDDLQELALVEAGQLGLSHQEIDLRELVHREVRTLRPQADAAGIEMVPRLAPVLPLVSADAGRLGQVLRNLLRNALAHTPSGGRVEVVAELDAEVDPARPVVLRVRDNGSGIAPEDLPHVFERFYRGDKSRTRQPVLVGNHPANQGGYGLGLTIARELVQAHGGEIAAHSTLGQGTEFIVRLPLLVAPEPPPPQPETLVKPRPASKLELLRTGVLVGALFGATAGLVESALLAYSGRRLEGFVEVFGYAVLLDAAVFGLLGAAGTGLALLVGRLLRRPLDPARQVRIWAPLGCLLVGLLAYLRWEQLYAIPEAPTPRAMFAQAIIVGLAAWVALLAVMLLTPRDGGNRRALVFGRRLGPALLAVLVGLAGAGVVRDLGGRGFGPGADPAQASTVGQPGQASAATLRGPNVILVSIDSLRADHLGAAGYARARTPVLDRLAANGVYFTNAQANSVDTSPAQASIFTGVYPAGHSLRDPSLHSLRSDLPTLAEAFGVRGYATAGFSSSSVLGSVYSGLGRGFKVYSDQTARSSDLADPRASALIAAFQRLRGMLALPGAVEGWSPLEGASDSQSDGRADLTTNDAIAWLNEHQARSRASTQPFFLWVHYSDPQAPYTPPPPFDRLEPDGCASCLDGGPETIRQLVSDQPPELSVAQINRLRQYYDGEVAFTDRELGRLLQSVQALGLEQNTLVVVVGSHGENLGEHGFWLHGRSLNDGAVHVPLLMRFPAVLPAGKQVEAIAQQVDLMPTMLELLGMPVPPSVEGQSLLPLIREPSAGGERYAIVELTDRSAVSIVTQEWRLIKNTQKGWVGLYRLVEDVDAPTDVADEEPEVVAELEALLEVWRSRHP